MTSLMHLSQHSDRLVLAYPAWVGIAFIVAAVVLVVCVVFGGQRTRRRSLFGVASVVAAWAGLYFATFNATITHETGSVSAFMHDHVVEFCTPACTGNIYSPKPIQISVPVCGRRLMFHAGIWSINYLI